MARTDHPARKTGHRWLLAVAGVVVAGAAACALGGCGTVGYYSRLAVGEGQVLLARKPLAKVIADPATKPELKKRLEAARKARAFASAHLDLPDNKSYTTYADIHRPFVMYNVFATPALSLKPVEHCFLFAGCVAYQGFYHPKQAKRAARKLAKRGDDTYIGGVPAYSTLGHFADPILSSMNSWSEDELIGTIFHELAHQRLYVKGDTRFNESFATFVQRQGLKDWRDANHLPAPPEKDTRDERIFTGLILATRKHLKKVYASDQDDTAKLAAKAAAFATLKVRYAAVVKHCWNGKSPYRAWMAQPINNARLLPFGLYDADTPAFAKLFAETGDRWPAFYERVRHVAHAGKARRKQFLATANADPGHDDANAVPPCLADILKGPASP